MRKPALLLTRPQASAMTFAKELDPNVLRGVRLCVSPLVQIQPLDVDYGYEGYAGAIFTSPNAVKLAAKGNGNPAYCVGQRAAEMALLKGWNVVAEAEDAAKLIAKIAEFRRQGPLIHLSGTHRRGEIAEKLTELGLATDVRAIYDQVLLSLNDEAQHLLRGNDPVIVPLFSPRTAVQFVNEARKTGQAVLLAISDAVAEAVGNVPLRALHIARSPTAEDMRRGVENLLRGDRLA